jgi:hypothetical protein
MKESNEGILRGTVAEGLVLMMVAFGDLAGRSHSVHEGDWVESNLALAARTETPQDSWGSTGLI